LHRPARDDGKASVALTPPLPRLLLVEQQLHGNVPHLADGPYHLDGQGALVAKNSLAD
jgi:hypothetical protein